MIHGKEGGRVIKGLRPGGFLLTERAIRSGGFPPGGRLLDVGCGRGDTVAYLAAAGYDAYGIDLDGQRILLGRELYPGLNLIEGDGCQLPFDGKMFDGVLMECSLPCIYNRKEALHEAYCVLKDKGTIVIHAPCLTEPSQEQLQRLSQVRNTHGQPLSREEDGCCRTMEELADRDECGIDGVLLLDEVAKAMTEIGFDITGMEDYTGLMTEFMVEFLLNGALREDEDRELAAEYEYYKRICGLNGVGYFQLTAGKRG